jgi:hypothetical protein
MIPEVSSGTLNGKPTLLQYIPGKHALHCAKGDVTLNVSGNYPESGDIEIEVNPEKAMKFPLVLRAPEWAEGFQASVDGKTYTASDNRLVEIEREWAPGDKVQVTIPIAVRIVDDTDAKSEMKAFARGPQVLALDDSIKANGGLPEEGWWPKTVVYSCAVQQWDYQKVFMLVPFADVGQTKAEYTALYHGIEGMRGAARPIDINAEVAKFAPGWSAKNCLDDSNPGINAEVRGKKNVLVTHPLNESIGCELSAELEIPKGKPSLRLVVGHHPEGDWTLLIKANGIFLMETDIGKAASTDGWMEVDVDLSSFAGQKAKLSLSNIANGWADEAGYWAKIELINE